MLVLLLVILVALLAVGAAVGVVIDRGYRRELQGWAVARNWGYREQGSGDWTAFLPRGRRQGVKVQLDGGWQGRPTTVADYWYQVRRNARTAPRTYHLTVVVVHLTAPFPTLVLHPRALGRVGQSIASAVGLSSAHPTGVPGFDNRFRVEADQDGRALLTEPVIQATLQADLPGWQLRGGDLIIVWRGGLNAPDLDHKLDQAVTLATRLDQAAGR